MKILVCFGTRPEAIKLAPVIQELRDQSFDFEICVTAQHREMLDQVLGFFNIKPDYDLDLMKPGQSLNSLGAIVLKEIDNVFDKSKPSLVLVQGDTTTALIVALAAFNRQIKIGHIEAGLRTGNLDFPFPEEANRQLISRISNFHFTPTSMAGTNLLKELIPKEKIFLTGNTIIDALFISLSRLEKGYINDEIKGLQAIFQEGKKFILVTGHRRENFGRGIEEVCEALLEISSRKEIQIIFPVHLNPKVKETVYSLLSEKEGVHLMEPLNYPALVWLMKRVDLIISDSGGLQEEAPSLKVPILVTRNSTERPEGVEAGYSFLTGTSKNKIVSVALHLLDTPPDYSEKENPYGDGTASKKIIQVLKNISV